MSNKPKFDEEFFQQMFKRQEQARLALFGELNKTAKRGAVVFTGDSITEFYPLQELFIDRTDVYNRGISGVTSGYILQNIDRLVLELSPGNVFLMIGTNDLFFGTTPNEVCENIKEICAKIHSRLPDTKIYVISVYPLDEEHEYPNIIQGTRTNKGILDINRLLLDTLDFSDKLEYIDMHSELRNSNGNLLPEYTTDGLHLSVQGYHKVTSVLLKYLP